MFEGKKDLSWFLVVLLVLAVLIGILPMLMWGPWDGHMSGTMGMMGFGWGWGFMFLIPLAFLVLIVLGAYYLITEFTKTGKSIPSRGERALEILRERYARGEITREEYLKMKEELES